jgi:hypothetical protein
MTDETTLKLTPAKPILPTIAQISPAMEYGDVANRTPAIKQPTMLALANIVEVLQADRKSYSDLTRHFLNRSNTGNLYVLVLYAYDNNAILVELLQNRSNPQQLQAYKQIIDQAYKGSMLQAHWMDNEASAAVKEKLKGYNIEYQLVLPHIHWHNAAKRAIWTFKNHFIAGMCLAAQDFPFHYGIDCYTKRR